MQLDEKRNFLKKAIIVFTSTNRYLKAEKYLLNFNFIRKKTFLIGVNSLIEDFKLILEENIIDNTKKTAFELILLALEQSAHILKENPRQISSQLIGYLEKDVNVCIDSIIKSIDKKTNGVWLKPMLPNLASQQGPLEKVFAGHSENVTAIEVSTSKKRIISGSSKGVIKIWNLESTNNTYTFIDKHDDGAIITIKDINDNYIITLSSNSKRITLKIWDIENKSLINRVSGEKRGKVSKVEVTPKGDYIITKSLTDDKAMVVWKIPTLKVHQIIKFKEKLDVFEVYRHQKNWGKYKFKNNQDDFRIVTSSYHDTYRDKLNVYRFKWGRFWVVKKFFVDNISNLNSLIIREKTNSIVVSGLGRNVKIHALNNGKCLYNIRVVSNEEELVTGLFLTKDEENLIVFSNKCSLWNIKKEKLIKIIKSDIRPTYQNGIIKKGEYAFSDDEDSGFSIWDLEKATIIDEINLSYSSPQNFKAVNGTQIISNEWHNVNLWNLQRTLSQKNTNHQDIVRTIKVFDNGKRAISGSLDKKIKIFNLENYTCSYSISENNGSIDVIDVFKKGDDYLAIASEEIDGEQRLNLWNVSEQKYLFTLNDYHLGEITRIEVIKKGRMVISISTDLTAKVWNLINGECIYTFYINNHSKEKEYGYGVVFQVYNHNRNLITGTTNGTLRIWDLQFGRLLKELDGHRDSIFSIKISSNGRFAMSSSTDGSIILWNLENFKYDIIVKDNTKSFFEVCFIPYQYIPHSLITKIINKTLTDLYFETHILSTCLKNKKIELWEISSKKCIQTFIGHTNEIGFLFVFEKLSNFLSLSYTGEIILWNIYSEIKISSLYLGRSISSATLTPDEKTLIVGEANGQLHFFRIMGDTPILKIMHSKY